MYRSIEKNKQAFTLAEVLITLAIIGVIASMTIPSLMNSTNNSEIVAKVRKYTSVINDAVLSIMSDKGISDLSAVYANSDAIWADLMPRMNVIKDCGTLAGQGCFAKGVTYKNLNGTDNGSGVLDDMTGWHKAIIADGMTFAVTSSSANCNLDRSINNIDPLYRICFIVDVDVNGGKGPNQYGRDTFTWAVSKYGTVTPYGTSDSLMYGCDPKSSDITGDASGTPGAGQGCTAKILQEGAVNY